MWAWGCVDLLGLTVSRASHSCHGPALWSLGAEPYHVVDISIGPVDHNHALHKVLHPAFRATIHSLLCVAHHSCNMVQTTNAALSQGLTSCECLDQVSSAVTWLHWASGTPCLSVAGLLASIVWVHKQNMRYQSKTQDMMYHPIDSLSMLA